MSTTCKKSLYRNGPATCPVNAKIVGKDRMRTVRTGYDNRSYFDTNEQDVERYMMHLDWSPVMAVQQRCQRHAVGWQDWNGRPGPTPTSLSSVHLRGPV